jgi:Ulp1 family protease
VRDLLSGDLLDDSIINLVGEYVTSQGPDVLFLTPCFFTILEVIADRESRRAEVVRSLKGADFMPGSTKRVVTVMNIGRNHWVTCVFDIAARAVIVADSMAMPLTPLYFNVLVDLCAGLHGHNNPTEKVQWRLNQIQEAGQRDGVNCGVFALWYAMVFAENMDKLLDLDSLVLTGSMQEMMAMRRWVIGMLSKAVELKVITAAKKVK